MSDIPPEWEDVGKPLDEADYGGSLWQLLKAWWFGKWAKRHG